MWVVYIKYLQTFITRPYNKFLNNIKKKKSKTKNVLNFNNKNKNNLSIINEILIEIKTIT